MISERNEQKILVLGTGLGGLIAATFLAKNNLPVLLLMENSYQSACSIQGYRFVPFSNFSEKHFKLDLIKKISQLLQLALPFEVPPKGRITQPISSDSRRKGAFQVILPRSRIDLFSPCALSQKEWKREFPGEVNQIERWYDQLEQCQKQLQKIQQERNLSPFFPIRAKKYFFIDPFPKGNTNQSLLNFSKEFREFIKLQLISWGNLYAEDFPISYASHILFNFMDETHLSGDIEKLEQGILHQFLRHGGKIEKIDGVKKIEWSWRKGQTLYLEGYLKVIHSKWLIINSPLHRLIPFLGKKQKRWLRWTKAIRPSFIWIPFFMGIREKGVPVGMNNLLISILDLEKPYTDGNLLCLSLSPEGDKTHAPEGYRALTIESLMEASKWEQTLLVDYQRGVMKHLDHLFPFLEKHIEWVDFQWASEHIPKWSYPHFLYEPISKFDWGKGMVPIKIAKNIYFIGKENYPYLGVEGEIFSGLRVGQDILKKYSSPH